MWIKRLFEAAKKLFGFRRIFCAYSIEEFVDRSFGFDTLCCYISREIIGHEGKIFYQASLEAKNSSEIIKLQVIVHDCSIVDYDLDNPSHRDLERTLALASAKSLLAAIASVRVSGIKTHLYMGGKKITEGMLVHISSDSSP